MDKKLDVIVLRQEIDDMNEYEIELILNKLYLNHDKHKLLSSCLFLLLTNDTTRDKYFDDIKCAIKSVKNKKRNIKQKRQVEEIITYHNF